MRNDRQLAEAFRAAYEDILDESPLAPDWEHATGQVVSLHVEDSGPRFTHALAGIAAVVVFAVASLGAYFIFMGSADDSPPAVTTDTEVTQTTAAITTGTVAATTTTLAAVPVVPPGEGLRLEFVEGESPDPYLQSGGVWHGGFLYAASYPDVFRSTDGLAWEPVTGLPDNAWPSFLRTSGDLLVHVVTLEDVGAIRVNTSLNGDDWASSDIDVPMLNESNGAGEFTLDNSPGVVVSGSPHGIIVAATVGLQIDGERYANTLVNSDDGVHVDVVGLDLDRGVMTVQYIDESSGETVGDPRDVDLGSSGFGRNFSDILEAMTADPIWQPLVDSVVSQFTGRVTSGFAHASVAYAWFSPDGVTWEPIPRAGVLEAGGFASILSTSEGFVATARNGAVWESNDGTTWRQDASAGNRHGLYSSSMSSTYNPTLFQWQDDIVEYVGGADRRVDDPPIMTLTDPPQELFSGIPTRGMVLETTELGLLGTPTYGLEGPDRVEVLLSVDGSNWNRWEPAEFGLGDDPTEAQLIGVGDDFVVIQLRRGGSYEPADVSLWVGTMP